ncbi:MAG TPA: hypothetical protein VGI79_17285 [Caulobacteraceae bacterium]|jgi:hypothetical protein
MAGAVPIPSATEARASLADPGWMIGAGVGLLLLAMALFDPRLLNDGDTYWHLTAGDWMLSHGQVPHTDPFSFTRAGAPWQAHEWLSEVVMALAFRLGGWAGVVTLYGLSLAALALLLTAGLRRYLSALSLGLTLALALACVAPNLLARPHILILPIVVAWTAGLLKARAAGRAPPLVAAGLMLLWANLHGSFVFGFLLLGGFAFEALYGAQPAERWRTVRDWGLFGLAGLAAAAITPQGPMGLAFPFKLMGMTSLAGIDEWRPTDFSTLGPFEIALAATLFVGFSRGVKVAPIRLVTLIGLLHMALQHGRHIMVVALVAALLLAAPFAEALGQETPQIRPARLCAWLALCALALVLIGARAALPLSRPDGPTTPGAALDYVPAALRAQPVLNDYGFGGYLIFRGVRPYVDGRTDLYGDAFMHRYYRIVSPDPALLDQTLSHDAITWTILPPNQPLVALMDARPGWRRLYADRFAVVHVREDIAAQAAGR